MNVSSSHDAAGPLAGFLRARRGQVQPEHHGLAAGAQRQVPGLRRDEVALLAGISTDYYVRLEQGRERRPSRTVVDGLSEALLLDGVAARHLRGLAASGTDTGMNMDTDQEAGEGREAGRRMYPRRLASVRRLLGSLAVPALLVNRRLDILAVNPLGGLLHEGLDPRDNYARLVFLAPAAPSFFAEWPELARCMVAALRAQAGPETESTRLTPLVEELAAGSDVFRTAWGEHQLYEKAMDRKIFHHPRVGPLVLDQHVLELPDSDGHRIWAFHPADDAASRALLALGSPGAAE
ncbi:helix-turn-helix domain-containing protein [Streptomyces sp. NPDC057654]|uniref:helix-turn-helix domain-containing protein n=1 Tax=Streptomyces sp. NPDC057654 TaxID=3346196 RepID=UPI00368D6B07